LYGTKFCFSHPDFVPLFLEDYPQPQRDEALAVCGSDTICTVDYLATKNAELAISSSNTSAESKIEDEEFGKCLCIKTCIQLHYNCLLLLSCR